MNHASGEIDDVRAGVDGELVLVQRPGERRASPGQQFLRPVDPGHQHPDAVRSVIIRDDGADMRVAGAADSVPAFPRGVHWEGDALIVGGTKYRLGEHVEFGGGVLAEVGASTPPAADVPAKCAGWLLWLISAQ